MWKAVCNHLHVAAVTTTAVLAILKSSGVMMDTLWKTQPFLSLYFENLTEDYLSTLMIAATLHTAISVQVQWLCCSGSPSQGRLGYCILHDDL